MGTGRGQDHQMSPLRACLRNSEEASDNGATQPQEKAGGIEIKETVGLGDVWPCRQHQGLWILFRMR